MDAVGAQDVVVIHCIIHQENLCTKVEKGVAPLHNFSWFASHFAIHCTSNIAFLVNQCSSKKIKKIPDYILLIFTYFLKSLINHGLLERKTMKNGHQITIGPGRSPT